MFSFQVSVMSVKLICLMYPDLELPVHFDEVGSKIADVAVRKRHQRQDEIMIFFIRNILESAKLFSAITHA